MGDNPIYQLFLMASKQAIYYFTFTLWRFGTRLCPACSATRGLAGKCRTLVRHSAAYHCKIILLTNIYCMYMSQAG